MRLFLLSILFLISLKLNSATLYSRTTGNWGTLGTWSTVGCGGISCGCVPSNNDIVIICATHTVTILSNLTIGGGAGNPTSVTVNGTLIIDNNDLLVKNGGTLTVNGSMLDIGNAQFANGSVVSINSGSVFDVNNNLTNNNNSTGITIDGEVSVGGNFSNGTGGVITGVGTVSVVGTSSGSGTIFGGPTTGTNVVFGSDSLPVELLYFRGEVSEYYISLYWATATETNNKYFIVERSNDAFVWVVIANVDGSINSQTLKEYYFKDTNVDRGQHYYRLTQVDLDGKREVFKIISLNNSELKEKRVYKVINIVGQEVPINYGGLKIIIYEDGTIKKTF